MMLLILDENPSDAARKVPDRLKHKQLLELMQMISCIVDFGYDKILQGNAIKEWIMKNIDWTYVYAKTLVEKQYMNLKEETRIKYQCLLDLLILRCKYVIVPNLKTAIFRYVKEYEEFTEYSTNTELPIETAIKEYEKYVEFKKDKWKGE